MSDSTQDNYLSDFVSHARSCPRYAQYDWAGLSQYAVSCIKRHLRRQPINVVTVRP